VSEAPRPDVDPWSGAPRAQRPPLFSFPLKVLWTAIGLLVVALVVGFLLPGTWEAERSATVSAPPPSVFGWLEDPRRWGPWTALGPGKTTFSGPERGAGATVRWDDPEVGDGVFTLVSTEPEREVRYRVEVQGGSMVTEGTFRIEPAGAGTRVVWTERGDFGNNPLLGYTALGMDRVQGAQMEIALARMAEEMGRR
jgi:carbon monoxide dehydrogenase subunit G